MVDPLLSLIRIIMPNAFQDEVPSSRATPDRENNSTNRVLPQDYSFTFRIYCSKKGMQNSERDKSKQNNMTKTLT